MMRIDVKESKGLKKKINEQEFKKCLKAAITETALDTLNKVIFSQNALIYNTPQGKYKRTGNLKRSNSITPPRLQGNLITSEIKNSTRYWSYVNFGTSKQTAKPFVQTAIRLAQPSKSIAQNFLKLYN